MKVTLTDADGFHNNARHADLAIIVISRADIEAMRVGSTVERLMLFSDDTEQVLRFAGRMVLQVEGYDADPRPLALIPECVRFFRAVDAQWHYWLHFLLPLADQIQLIFLMLVDMQVQEQHGAQIGYAPRHPEQMDLALDRLLDAVRVLHDIHGVPQVLGDMVAKAARDALSLSG